MTKVIAFTCLHYGKSYFAAAIQSVIDTVDEYYVIYTDEGSHGHKSGMVCPDKRSELMGIAHDVAGRKLRWFDGKFATEGMHRDTIYHIAKDADIILTVDSDELFPDGIAAEAIALAKTSGVRDHRLPFVHFWRSFRRAVIHDPAYPVRIVNTQFQSGVVTLPVKPVAHMGYAIPVELCRYKLSTHGHHDQFRKDVNWLDEVYIANRQTDMHVVGSEYWNAETVEPLDYLPSFMVDHPYFNLEVIP